jgi:DHA1 family tetracycline resistance protein-like MFS transporter
MHPLVVIFVTVFVDMLSFGLVIPDLQIRAPQLGAGGWKLGVVQGAFSFCTFLAAPWFGRLSDRVGRKPVLALGALLNAGSFLLYAYAHDFPSLLLARVLGGLGSANLSAAFAYVSDVSGEESRAKSFGFLGAAFGLGFIFGPMAGGVLAERGGNWFLGIVAMTVALLNFVWILFALQEAREPATSAAVFNLRALREALAVPGMAALLILFGVYNFGFSNLEATFVRLMNLNHGLNREHTGYILGFVGVCMAFVQAGLVGRTAARFGERWMVRLGLLVVVPVFAILPFVPTVSLVYLVVLPLAVGAGMAGPGIQSLISRTAPASVQGGMFGITQGLGALARTVGPIVGNTLFEKEPAYPYMAGALIILVPVAISWLALPSAAPSRESAP